MPTTPEQKEEEAVLFAVLTSCLCYQTLALEGQYQKNAKRLTNTLIGVSKQTLAEIQKEWPQEAKDTLDELYDYFYAINREAVKVHTHETDAFLEHIKAFTARYDNQPQGLAIFNPTTTTA
jgi:hypothetical protein